MTERLRFLGPRRVAIVGIGLIGGSLAAALKQSRPDVMVVGIDRGRRPGAALVPLDGFGRSLRDVADADLVVLAAPVDVNLAVLAEVARYADPAATITDVGSTKRAIVRHARSLGLAGRFVGGHPMAGLAVSGVRHATPGLFQGAPWILTPGAGTPSRHLSRVTRLVKAVGGRPVNMAANLHDRALAYVSHLPQLLASCLMRSVGEAVGERGVAVSGTGLFDTTRLASSDAGLWTAILAQNADEVVPALRRYRRAIADIERRLRSPEDLRELFDAAQRWRAVLERSHRQRHSGR